MRTSCSRSSAGPSSRRQGCRWSERTRWRLLALRRLELARAVRARRAASSAEHRRSSTTGSSGATSRSSIDRAAPRPARGAVSRGRVARRLPPRARRAPDARQQRAARRADRRDARRRRSASVGLGCTIDLHRRGAGVAGSRHADRGPRRRSSSAAGRSPIRRLAVVDRRQPATTSIEPPTRASTRSSPASRRSRATPPRSELRHPPRRRRATTPTERFGVQALAAHARRRVRRSSGGYRDRTVREPSLRRRCERALRPGASILGTMDVLRRRAR